MKNVLFLVLTVTSINCFGQYNSTHQTNIVFQKAPRGFMTSLPPAEPGTIGSYFLYEDYSPADIYLKDSTKLEDIQVRLDLKSNMIEVQFNNGIKILPVSKVMSMTLKRPNAAEEFLNGGLVASISKLYRDQLVRVLVDGEVALLSNTKAQLKAAQRSQNPMLGDNRDDNEIVHNKVYLIVNKKDFVTTANGKSTFRKDMIALFGEEKEPLVKKVNPKSELDLVLLVNELNKPKS
jgi:hypothetical protein